MPVPIQSRKSRSWVWVLLAMWVAGGGAYWWLTRLTPDEQVFLGRWKIVDSSRPASEQFVELYSDRTYLVDGTRLHWSAHQGKLKCWAVHPFYQLVLVWVQSGFKKWDLEDVSGGGRYEIINHNQILIREEGGEVELHRVIPE